MIWRDKVATVVSGINAQSFYNASRTTTPAAFDLQVYNQSQDWLCMYKPWRDLQVRTQLTLDDDNYATLPDNFGCCIYVYADPSSLGIPTQYYYLDHIDPAKRYTREISIDDTTGIKTIKYKFPRLSSMGNPWIVYSRTIPNIVQSDVDDNVKYSFFPINIMLATAKKILYDYYGISGNQRPEIIFSRLNEEIKMMQAYAMDNNAPLDLTPHDGNGQPIYISGPSLDGSYTQSYKSPYPNSVILPGGA